MNANQFEEMLKAMIRCSPAMIVDVFVASLNLSDDWMAQFSRHLGCKPWFWQWCTKTRSETTILEDHQSNLVIEADLASPVMITDVLVASLNLSDNWMAQFRRHSGCKPWFWQWCTKTMSETMILEEHDALLNSSYTIRVSLVIETNLTIFRLFINGRMVHFFCLCILLDNSMGDFPWVLEWVMVTH